MKNHQAAMALLISLPNTPFEKNKRKRITERMHECTLTQGFLIPRQWKTMVQRLWHQPRGRNRLSVNTRQQDNHDGRTNPPPWASIFTLQSVEKASTEKSRYRVVPTTKV